MGVIIGTELAMERMSLTKGGQGGLVVNTASIAGLAINNPFLDAKLTSDETAEGNVYIYPYIVSKQGVVALTRMLGV